jgi:hypothetical protein
MIRTLGQANAGFDVCARLRACQILVVHAGSENMENIDINFPVSPLYQPHSSAASTISSRQNAMRTPLLGMN